MSIYKELGIERKMLQDSGELPKWVTTNSYQMLKEKYLDEGETLKGRYTSIARTASNYMPEDMRESWFNRFYELLWNGWLAASTPVLANMGKKSGCPVSCSGGYIGDSVFDFYSGQVEVAMLSKNGFGTSGYMGDIRPRGAPISNIKGGASGVVPVFKDYVQVARDISQGSSRRGAFAAYLPIDHDDFDELVIHISKYPDDANIGWSIPQSFIDRLDAGEEEAIRRYQKVLKLKMLTGKGYFFFVDKVNRLNPGWYVDKGIKVQASNLCVAPETKVLTDKGYIQISDLEGEDVNAWNGEEFSNVKVYKTGVNQRLITIHTSSGQTIDCTPYHKFYVQEGYSSAPIEKRASELSEGDRLIKFSLPVIEGDMELSNPYANGFYSGDGCYYKGKQIIYLYGEKKKLLGNFSEVTKSYNIQDAQDRIIISAKSLLPKFFVPVFNYSIDSKLKWLAGISDSDGTIAVNGTNRSLQIGSTNKEFLLEIQEMLQTLGVTSKITLMKEEGYNLLPANDGTGGNKFFYTKENYRLLVSSSGLFNLKELGFKTFRLDIDQVKPQRNAEHFIKVVEVEDSGRIDDTYCFTEPKRNMGMFNGILTGNCTEIALYSSSTESFTCVLSSLNLSMYDEWRYTSAIFDSLVFLHCVALNFIDIGKDIKGLEKTVEFTRNNMALGLGALGFHTYLQDHMIPIESMDAYFINTSIFKEIDDKSLLASQWLAGVFGECKMTKGHGVANSHRIAIAPNLSSALICGGVSNGIEPVYKNSYVQGTSSGEMNRINPSLLNLLKSKGVYNEEVITSIINNNGSVKHLSFLSDFEKSVFKTAFEIDQKQLIRLASSRQRYIDQAQSINLFFSSDEDESYISEVHQLAFKDPYIKSLYYIRSESGVQASKGECIACEG